MNICVHSTPRSGRTHMADIKEVIKVKLKALKHLRCFLLHIFANMFVFIYFVLEYTYIRHMQKKSELLLMRATSGSWTVDFKGKESSIPWKGIPKQLRRERHGSGWNHGNRYTSRIYLQCSSLQYGS